MKNKKLLLTGLTIFILVGTFFTAGFYNETQNDNSAETEQVHGDGVMKEQSAGTEGGTTKRYIDISNPFTGAYLHEDMKIEGEAEVRESFTMGDVDAGANVQAGVDEEGGTKDASVGIEESGSGETAAEPEQENNNEGNPGAEEDNPGDQKDNNPEDGKATGYILEPASPPEWADLF